MVLKEVQDSRSFTMNITVAIGYSLFGSCIQCVKFKVQSSTFQIGNCNPAQIEQGQPEHNSSSN